MTDWPYPFWIAHRGAGKLAPENTLAAFRVGAGHGYRAFECDVKLSADGVPFLLHDASLQRTTAERGVAGERPWSVLSRIDAGGWHGRTYAGEMIPSLEGIAAFCLRNDFALDIEIKPTPGAEAATGRVVADAATRLWADAAIKPLLTSFSPDALAAAHASQPAVPRGLLLDAWRSGWLEEAQGLACAAVVTNYTMLDRQRIEHIHDIGMRVLAYTVNDPATARWLVACGIDGIVTDAVDRFSPASRDTLG
jgi:glycerophosphoryl diester phosphodiesterase